MYSIVLTQKVHFYTIFIDFFSKLGIKRECISVQCIEYKFQLKHTFKYCICLLFSLNTQPLIAPLAVSSHSLQSATFYKFFLFFKCFFSFLPFSDSFLSFYSFYIFFSCTVRPFSQSLSKSLYLLWFKIHSESGRATHSFENPLASLRGPLRIAKKPVKTKITDLC